MEVVIEIDETTGEFVPESRCFIPRAGRDTASLLTEVVCTRNYLSSSNEK